MKRASVEGMVEQCFLEAWSARRADPAEGSDVVEEFHAQGAELARRMGVEHESPYHPIMVKACGWAIAARRPEVVSICPGVAELAREIECHGPPERAPALLADGAVFVRTKSTEPLIGSVRAVAMYRVGGAWYVHTFEGSTEGYETFCYRFALEWGAPTLNDAVAERRYDGPDIPNDQVRNLPGEKARARLLPVIRWVLALGALLDAKGAPLVTQDGAAAERILRPKRYKAAQGVRYRTINLSRAGVRPIVHTPSGDGQPHAREGLVRREVDVRPFLRRQACGPRQSERRWVYVESFRSARWSRDGEPPLLKSSIRRAREAVGASG